MSVERDAADANHVRIPPDLNARISEFFSELQLQVLGTATQMAQERTRADDCILEPEDVLAAAQVALKEATSRLRQVIAPFEPDHVRRAS